MAHEPSRTDEELQELCGRAIEEGSLDVAFVLDKSGMLRASEQRPGAAPDTIYLANLVARAGEDWILQLMREGENTVVDSVGRGAVHARVLGENEILIVSFPSTTPADQVRTVVAELLRSPSPHGPIRPPRPPSA